MYLCEDISNLCCLAKEGGISENRMNPILTLYPSFRELLGGKGRSINKNSHFQGYFATVGCYLYSVVSSFVKLSYQKSYIYIFNQLLLPKICIHLCCNQCHTDMCGNTLIITYKRDF